MDQLSTGVKSALFCVIAAAFIYGINKIRSSAASGETTKDLENTQIITGKSKINFLYNLTYLHKARPLNSSAPTLLVCFGTNCGPCKAEIPHIGRISKYYPTFNVIAAATESKDKIQAFIDENQRSKEYSVAADESGYTRGLMYQYNINGIPHCFLFDDKGGLAWHGHPSEVDPHLRKIAKAAVAQFTGKGRKL